MRARWTIAGWPADHWAARSTRSSSRQGEAPPGADLLLLPADGRGRKGHERLAQARPRARPALGAVTKLGLARPRAARARHGARCRLVRGHTLARRPETPQDGRDDRAEHADRGGLHEPGPAPTNGTFRCTFPLSFRGRLIEGLRGEFSGAGSSGSTRTPTTTATSSPPTSTPTRAAGGSARSRSSTPRRASARPGASTTTRCSTRTPRRTSLSAAASEARDPRQPARGGEPLGDPPRRHDRRPGARGDGLRRPRPADPADPRGALADLRGKAVAIAVLAGTLATAAGCGSGTSAPDDDAPRRPGRRRSARSPPSSGA